MISLTINAESVEQFHQELAAILAGNGSSSDTSLIAKAQYDLVPLAEPAKRGRPSKAEPAPSDLKTMSDASTATNQESQARTEAGAASAEVEAGDTADVTLTYNDHVKPAILKVSAHPEDKGGGRPGVEKLVKQFGGETEAGVNAKFIPEANWPDLLAAVDALLEAA